METEILKIYDPQADSGNVLRAAEILSSGGTVIFPTETVYGLGANGLDADAAAKIFAAKERPADNPLIVHITEPGQLEPLVTAVPDSVAALAERFWPGPLTIILPKRGIIPSITSGGLDTVAVRMPSDPVARAIIAACGFPVAAPSANRSGSPSPTTFARCVDDMMGRVDAIVESHPCRVGVESTVISLAGEVPVLLRPGAVTPEELREVLGEIMLGKGITERLEDDAEALSPGMKYKHYSPRANVILIRGSSKGYRNFLAGMDPNNEEGFWAMCFDEDENGIALPHMSYGPRGDHRAQAACIFELLRSLDDRGASRIYIHSPEPDGVGLAVYNRLVRAAGFKIIDVV